MSTTNEPETRAPTPEEMMIYAQERAAKYRRTHPPEVVEDLIQTMLLSGLEALARATEHRNVAGFVRVSMLGGLRHFWRDAARDSKTAAYRQAQCLDAPLPDSNASTVDLVPASTETPADLASQAEQEALLRNAVEGLPEVQAEVIRCRFFKGLTLSETSECVGVSRERVRQIEQDALSSLSYRV